MGPARGGARRVRRRRPARGERGAGGGAGLSSSAALEVATALALDGLYGLGPARPELARLAQRAENAFVGVPCGIMDQMASACCTEGHVLHLDTRDLSWRQIPFDPAAWGLRLLVVDTGVKHEVGDGEYARRREGCEAAARALGVRALRDIAYEELDAALARLPGPGARALVRHVVGENHRVEQVAALLDAGDPRLVGPLLTAGHASLRDDFAVSCAELDLVVAAACGAGALGGPDDGRGLRGLGGRPGRGSGRGGGGEGGAGRLRGRRAPGAADLRRARLRPVDPDNITSFPDRSPPQYRTQSSP
ncbi:hypothetical protein GCM10020000_48150 [Streptomyces olivoverticillatus]